jgi:hypothetical protein
MSFRMDMLATFCDTIMKCAHVGLRPAAEFDFTSAFVV